MGTSRKTYDFKSVGESKTTFDQKNQIGEVVKRPIGIATPIQLSSLAGDGPFLMHTELENVIQDNFRNLLQTNHGERLGLYDFGANLLELAFELGSEDADAEVIRRIKRAVSKYMPFINLETFQPINEKPEGGLARYGFEIKYSVPKANITNKGIKLILYAAS